MNQKEAKARAKALLTVIETSYAIKIVNLDEVVAAITEETHDEQKILMICTALNTWVAVNVALDGAVEIPPDIVHSIAARQDIVKYT